ncbi:hypothetical protein IM816_05940 [Luteibacter flocculans]|uniref:Uncharacterized protein n=1 Tax=Luteibacter flocculans TaxID=2780091 RepID=A0ABY4T6D4_9GAMM|nr:hypothetical protein [Luteibacter flocculans]URL59637.1 hypothetical protein IM816_05940 [Luteibacter flocculans]
MEPDEETIITVAQIVRDCEAMAQAALAGDFDEARFRAQLIIARADVAGHLDVVLAASYTAERLGPIGTVPRDGYGAGILCVADGLDRIGCDAL